MKELSNWIFWIIFVFGNLLFFAVNTFIYRKKLRKQFLIISLIFFISSILLFVNNLTEVFSSLNIEANIIAWTGIIISVLWLMVLMSFEQTG